MTFPVVVQAGVRVLIMRMVHLDNEMAPLPPKAVLDEYMRWHEVGRFGSPTSTNDPGLTAYEYVVNALESLERTLRAEGDLFLVGSGTEANNLALWGRMRVERRGNIVISSIEHESIHRAALEYSDLLGIEVRFVGVDEHGRVDPNELESLIDRDTILVSVQWINQEVGSMQPIDAISDVVRDKGAVLHVDACDALGRLDIDLSKVDMASFSARKLYGVSGLGILYVREGLKISPLLMGRETIQYLVATDIPVPTLAAFMRAFELYGRKEIWIRVKGIRDRLQEEISSLGVMMNSPEDAIDIVHFSTRRGALTLISEASRRGVFLSQGSTEPISRVLMAMGRDREISANGVQIKLHPETNPEEVDYTLTVLSEILKSLDLI